MIAYLIRSGALLTLYYLFFILFMRKTTFFRFNRILLLTGTALCMILPLADLSSLFSPVSQFVPHVTLPEVVVYADDAGPASGNNVSGRDWAKAIMIVYLTGVSLVMLWSGISLVRMYSIIRGGEQSSMEGVRVTVSDRTSTSFSFFNHIVMNREDFEGNPMIMRHEQMHVSCLHSLDIVVFEIVTVLHWFNPIVWLTRQELRQMHEYEADEAVIRNGVDAADYQMLIVKKSVGNERFQLANGFNHIKLINRITMIQKQRSSNWARLGYLACFPILALALCMFNIHPAAAQSNEQVVVFNTIPTLEDVDVQPTFNGGPVMREFTKWVSQNIQYPESAFKSGLSGTVTVSVLIQSNGNINPSLTKIKEGVSEELDNEVLRVVKSAPAFTPAKKDGKEISVQFELPIMFMIRARQNAE